MKKLLAPLLVLVASLAFVNDANAGVMYGNRMADRMSTGTNWFARFFRGMGRMEYRKDMWILGRPIGDEPTQFCPECGQPIHSNNNYYYPQPSTQPAQQPQQKMTPTPAPKQEKTTQAVQPAPASEAR